jgi:hypothetical protein
VPEASCNCGDVLMNRARARKLRAGKPQPHVARIVCPFEISQSTESALGAADPRAALPVPKLDRIVGERAYVDAVGRIVSEGDAVAIDPYLGDSELAEPRAQSFDRRFSHSCLTPWKIRFSAPLRRAGNAGCAAGTYRSVIEACRVHQFVPTIRQTRSGSSPGRCRRIIREVRRRMLSVGAAAFAEAAAADEEHDFRGFGAGELGDGTRFYLDLALRP